ncbi:MAG TPA: ABC transporter permease [Bryobacteraceae bacterium]|nr:ABC transporter permease [Bryobacteraceae bacterium]
MNRLASVWRFLFRRKRFEGELEAELRYHYEQQVEQNLARGMSRTEARRQAALQVGGAEQLKDDCRDARLGRWIETLVQDVRYGLRVLAKNPGFALAAILTLALGIGANTAIFSLVYGVLLRPLPYLHGDRLVVLHQEALKANVLDFVFSVKEINDYREQNHTLLAMAEHHTMNFLLIGKNTAERVETAVVSANFFDVLGVKPLLGRTFVAADEAPGGPAVLILSYQYWQTHQGGDPHIVGKVFQMNNRPHTVIGVLPPIPQYPVESDVYMPTSQCPIRSSAEFIANRNARMMNVFGRLKPGVTLAEAQADLSVIAAQIARDHPEIYLAADGYAIRVDGLRDDLTRRARMMFLVLLGVVGFVLLAACANVANLFLARLLKLERELAVRSALGAGKGRLVRQLLTESVLLAVGGGLLGVVLAPLSLRVLTGFAGRFTTRAAEVRMDGPVLLFTFLVSVGTGVVFGLAPVLTTSGWLGTAFQQAATRGTTSRGRGRLRSALVVAQVAFSVILLAAAGLMIRSFVKMQQVQPGFAPDRLITMRISPGMPPYTMKTVRLLVDRILDRIRGVPGVVSAAMATTFPFNPSGLVFGPAHNQYIIEGRPHDKAEPTSTTDFRVVTAGYFETIRQPIVKGRSFTQQDCEPARPDVVIINQAMARREFSGRDPIGQRVSLDKGEHWAEIVGIAGDVREYGLNRPAIGGIYAAVKDGFVNRLVVRTGAHEETEERMLRDALHDIDPLVAVDQVQTVEHAEYESLAPPRMMTFLMGIFAGLALLISASGIAAVMALSVSQRTREIGVRMALGAQRRSVVAMVVRQGMVLTVAGIAAGTLFAALLTKLLASLLYGTSPRDVLTFAAIPVVFLMVAAAACFVPARQATSIDPLTALRQE